MAVPTLDDASVRVRSLEERDIDAYLAAFARDGELLNLLGYEDEPTTESVRRWLPDAWVDPPELRSWEFVIADRKTDVFLGAIMILAEKFGFAFEGTLRKRNLERGRRVDLLLWALLKDERAGSKA